MEQWRLDYAAWVEEELSGSYNREGITAWWSRPRCALGGFTPREVLMNAWTPKDDDMFLLTEMVLRLRG